MASIGINFISENRDCYELLKKYKYIDTLKFPGKVCDDDELSIFVNYTQDNGFKIDLHGLPKMQPAFQCDNSIFMGNIEFDNLQQIFKNNNNVKRISTHMGIENKERLIDYSAEQLEENWNTNYTKLKNEMTEIFKHNIEIGLENIPGGFDFDPETLTPQFISENWKKADFGVFDIAHAKLSADVLNMNYRNYLEKLENTDKVRILHISGNTCTSEKYINKPDKHTLVSVNEFDDIIIALKKFKGLDLIISEYAYNNKYSSQKETLIEAVTIYKLVKFKDRDLAKKTFEYMERVLKDDISNAEEVLNNLMD